MGEVAQPAHSVFPLGKGFVGHIQTSLEFQGLGKTHEAVTFGRYTRISRVKTHECHMRCLLPADAILGASERVEIGTVLQFVGLS